MPFFIILLSIILIAFVCFLIACLNVYKKAFYHNKKKSIGHEEFPEDEQYSPYVEEMKSNVRWLQAQPHEEVSITSHDGLKLFADYYEFEKDDPVLIFFHGYRSTGVRDANGGAQACKKNGINMLIVDQRTHGRSEGKAITFGIKERYDCLAWTNYVVERFGLDCKILLMGVSMGAATVMMASDVGLPDNVKAILADCGFSSPKEIIRIVIQRMRYPLELGYWCLRATARLFCGFNVEETSAVQALKNNKIPTLFVHGDDDRYVPCDMVYECYEACASKKELVVVKGAGHGISYYVDKPAVEAAIVRVFDRVKGE